MQEAMFVCIDIYKPEYILSEDLSLLNWDEHEDQESWSEQHLLAFKASSDPDTMYHHR